MQRNTPTISVPEAGRLMGCGRSLSYKLARTGQLGVPVLRLGKKMRVPRAAVERLLEQNENQNKGEKE